MELQELKTERSLDDPAYNKELLGKISDRLQKLVDKLNETNLNEIDREKLYQARNAIAHAVQELAGLVE